MADRFINPVTIDTITDDRIRALLAEAKAAGDTSLAYTCRLALRVCTNEVWLRARKACVEVIREAEMNAADDDEGEFWCGPRTYPWL